MYKSLLCKFLFSFPGCFYLYSEYPIEATVISWRKRWFVFPKTFAKGSIAFTNYRHCQLFVYFSYHCLHSEWLQCFKFSYNTKTTTATNSFCTKSRYKHNNDEFGKYCKYLFFFCNETVDK